MSNYQTGQGKPDQAQPSGKLGAGQHPHPKPSQQADRPDQSNEKSKPSDKDETIHGSKMEKGLIHQLPGGEGG